MKVSLVGNKIHQNIPRLFAPTRWLQQGSIIVGSFIIILLTSLTSNIFPLLAVRIMVSEVVYCAIIIATHLLCTIWANRLLVNALHLLSEACDPESYLQAVQKMQSLQQGQDRGNIYYCKLLLSNGYLNTGDFATAESVLESVRLDSRFASDIFKMQCAQIYHLNKSICAMKRQDMHAAQTCLANADAALQGVQLSPRLQEYFQYCIEQVENKLRVYQGDYPAAQAFFQNDFAKAPNRLARVSAKYYCALAAQGCRQTEQAAEAWAYVAQNGGGTYVARLAQQALSEIGQ